MHRLLLAALALSLCLHLLTVGAPLLWQWWQTDALSADASVRASQQRLEAQTLSRQAGRRGADGSLLVQLGRSSGPQASPQAGTGQRAIHSAPAVASAAVPHATLAMQPAPAPAAASASAPAAAQAAAGPDSPAALDGAAADAPAPAATATVRIDQAFPHAVDIDYVAFGIVEAEHRWRAQDGQYEILTRIALQGREMRSVGSVGPAGLLPSRFSDNRVGQASGNAQATFDWRNKLVRLGRPGQLQTLPLSDGAQDLFSAAYQFALQGDSLPSFDMQVISSRHSYQVPFALTGESELQLGQQQVKALVLAGSHGQRRFEFYLAPQWHNLPVRIRMSEGEQVTDLRASRIRIDGTTVLDKPRPQRRDR